MRTAFGDIWTAWDKADLLLVTGCSALKLDGSLVMRSASAKAAATRFGEAVAQAMGAIIANHFPLLRLDGIHAVYGAYGLLVSPNWPDARLGLFQTRLAPGEPIYQQVIEKSVAELLAWLEEYPTAKVHLAWPGQHDPALDFWQVERYLEALPDNVTVWREEAPFIPDLRLTPGTGQYALAHGPGSPDGVKVGREEMEAHFWQACSQFIPRYAGSPGLAETEFKMLYVRWGMEWWQRVTQYEALERLAKELDGGKNLPTALAYATHGRVMGADSLIEDSNLLPAK